MEKKFSKGKWSVDEFDSNFDECFYISDANGNWIAMAIIDFPSWAVETSRANAKLIAAAPELLDSLNKLLLSVKAHPEYVNGEEGDEWHDIIDLAEQTIKKAIE